MSLPFDATLKGLGAGYPDDFVALFDQSPRTRARLLNADLSTVTAGADLVIGLGDPFVEIIHIDFQSSADADKGRDVLAYNSLLHRQYRVPVHSILVLLRPQAAHSGVSGTIAYAPRPGRGRMDFGYEVVRLWQRPAEELLRGPVGAVPLAILGALPAGAAEAEGLASVAQRVWERVEREAAPGVAAQLLRPAFELVLLRVKRAEGRAIFERCVPCVNR